MNMNMLARNEKVENLLKGFDIPEARRNAKPANLLWLLRNLAFRNSKHPNFSQVVAELTLMAREDNLLRRNELKQLSGTQQASV